MTDTNRHQVPLESDNKPGRRSGEGAQSILPHRQQQVQTKLPADPAPQPSAPQADAPVQPD